jgi:Holliday junction resolvase RusA-like endonuclease
VKEIPQNVSNSFRARNPNLYQSGGSTPRPKLERTVPHVALAADQGKEGHSGRIQICITSYRRRPLDPDNLAGGCKYFVDCCRYAKLIPDDRQQDIDFIAKQREVKKKEDERTEIEITYEQS